MSAEYWPQPKNGLAVIQPRDQVIAWLLEGHRDADVVEAIREKWPGADVAGLMTAAVAHFESAGRCDLSVVVGWGLEAYKDLYRRTLAGGDFDSARKCIKELIALAAKHVCNEDDESEAGTEAIAG